MATSMSTRGVVSNAFKLTISDYISCIIAGDNAVVVNS